MFAYIVQNDSMKVSVFSHLKWKEYFLHSHVCEVFMSECLGGGKSRVVNVGKCGQINLSDG